MNIKRILFACFVMESKVKQHSKNDLQVEKVKSKRRIFSIFFLKIVNFETVNINQDN